MILHVREHVVNVHDIHCDACCGIETVIKHIGAEIEDAFNKDGDVLSFSLSMVNHKKLCVHGKRILYTLLTKILPNKMC